MTDTIEFIPVEVDDDMLVLETGHADPAMLGNYTADAADEDVQDEPRGAAFASTARGASARYLTDLADVLRKAGLRVVEVAGWKTRGHGPMQGPDGVVCHHTGTSAKASGNYPSLRVVRDGRSDLPGPLCNVGLGRDGTCYVVAAGRAYHAGPTFQVWQSNTRAIGIEAEGDGGHPFPDVQLAAYVALCAALCEGYNIPTGQVESHKMVARPHYRKTDPFGVDMAGFRSQVAQARKDGITVTPPKPITHTGTPAELVEDGVMGARTVDGLLWLVSGDRFVGLTRDNVRDVQSYFRRDRTGVLSDDDVKAIQTTTGSTADGDWPRRDGQKSKTTLGVQRFINRRIAERPKEAVPPVDAMPVIGEPQAPAQDGGQA